MWVRGHSRSLQLVPFESLCAISYSPSIVTMAVSVAFCEIFSVKEWPDLKNRFAVDIGKRYGEIEHRCGTVLQRWRGSGGNVRPSHLLVRFCCFCGSFATRLWSMIIITDIAIVDGVFAGYLVPTQKPPGCRFSVAVTRSG